MDAGRDELAAVESTVEQVFGNKPAELVESEPFVQILEDLKDSIIAIKFVQEEHYRPIAGLSDQLRDLELIQKLAEEQSQSHALEPSGREFLQVEETEWSVGKQYDVGDRVRHIGIIYKCKKWHLSQSDLEPQLAPEFWEPVMPEVTKIDIPLYRKRTLLLPLEMDLKPLVSSPAEKRCEGGRDMCQDEKEAEKLLTEHTDLKSAIAELLKLSPESFEAEGPKGAEGADVDPKFTRNTIVGDQLEYRKSLRTIALVRANAVGSTSPDPSSVRLAANSPTPTTPTTPTNPVPPVNTEPIGAFNLAKELLSGEGMLGPLSAFKASPTAERTPRLKTDASQKLSDTTKKVLKEQGIDIATSSDLIPAAENVSYTRIGSAIISAKTPVLSRATGLLYGYDIPKDIPALPALPQDGRVPHTKGKATPSGIADLLVVKQTLKSYQAADIAHVENVLKGENKNRTHKKTTRTESMINFETETNSTDDHELSSTSRFEMSKETNNTLKEAQNLKAELKVSAKYGPAVTINASVEGSMSRNKEEANKAASKFAQDTTERTAKKVTERVLERQTTTNVLLSAYKQRLQDYEEKIAKLKINDGITIQGTNPTANLNTIKTELKKHCISILTGQHFELFNSLDRDLQGRWPEIDFSETEAEGTYVRFFEQAFEWDQLMFTTYPYFWGSRDYWVTKLAINDTDPVFDEFLKSGFARVVAPVRPGFEGAVDHFLRFGVPWNGGPLPLVTSQAYIAIADELAELKGKPEGETAQGEPWEITLPTTLLKLRGDDMLPTWTKVNGKWVPDV
ncbi:hypothetical protein N7481_010454 [Penicillium waksmanii]|uniref:uncharacterized protein n=1 Tax=Penicillium waksmanii TaxID=69791 RepID=UPI0025466383|nr:uncharacterized protein N7481_010454 [Penicillium waksmanii]KAJ5973244.1 hypothetical protein N7481_010454 [Penicillium waksmanii]